jgi:hypothetical protein
MSTIYTGVASPYKPAPNPMDFLPSSRAYKGPVLQEPVSFGDINPLLQPTLAFIVTIANLKTLEKEMPVLTMEKFFEGVEVQTKFGMKRLDELYFSE